MTWKVVTTDPPKVSFLEAKHLLDEEADFSDFVLPTGDDQSGSGEDQTPSSVRSWLTRWVPIMLEGVLF